MMQDDWKWKIVEAITRIQTRYDFIGRKTGVPFLPSFTLSQQKWHSSGVAHADTRTAAGC